MTELFQHRYFRINKFFLSIIGQWPYQNRTKRRTILVIFVLIAASQIIPQVEKYLRLRFVLVAGTGGPIIAVVEFWDHPDVIIESIPPFVVDVACGTKLANIFFNSGKMLKLVERIETDWMSLIRQPEVDVLHDYAEIGRKFTIAYAIGLYAVAMLFMTQPVVPQILKALKLTDQSESANFPFPVDYYGIDFETYYYCMLVHSYICVTAIVTVIVAADTMFIVYVQHACGMFTVVGRQMERMGKLSVPESYELHSRPTKDPTFQQLATYIKRHSDAIKFADLLESAYSWSFFSIVGINMLVMSVTGLQTVERMDGSPEEALRYGVFTVTQMAHLFFQSFFSQRLMDHSELIRDYMYQAEWYSASTSAQKLISLVAMRSCVPCRLTAGNVMVMSLENFTSVVKTSMSYFTLLRSMQ